MRQQRCPWVAAGLVLAVAGGAAAGGLGYVDASLGLETPAMEGGRTEVELGDVNGDGHPDVVCIGDHGSPYINTSQHGVMVWFGNGAGQWSVFQSGNFGYGGVALGDVNHDGLMDVGYGMHHDYSGVDLGDQILEVALGDGTGMNWTPWDDGLATNGEDWGMFGTDFADVDNDGDLDVGSNSFGCCAGVHVYLNHGDGTWTQSFGFLGGNSSDDFVFGDVNGDGLADFAASHGDGTVYVGDGQGDFSLADDNLPGPTWRKGVALGDVDGDGRDEVCFVTATGLGVWTRDDMGTWQDLSGALATAGDFDLTGVADMDLDGHGDVVAFRPDLVVVYGGDGAGGWQQIATINTPDACDYAALRTGTDVDHNGFPDIAIVSEENCQPYVGGTNRPRVYVEGSTPTVPSVYAKYPRGGEVLVAGSVRFIDWHAAVPPGAGAPSMTIELSTAGPDGPWSTVAEALVDNGRYQWLVPVALPESETCYLRLTLGTSPPAVALTPAPFTILGAAEIPGDLDGDGVVGVLDFLLLLAAWGQCPRPCPPLCAADLDGDCYVSVTDFLMLLANWSAPG
ncbi:MAG: FG-GAP-like repeat-containing protein [Planctomycetota bacterium]|jgi:hypothetical protein